MTLRGSLWGWGYEKIFGLPSTLCKDIPHLSRIGLDKDWRDVSAGSLYMVATKTDGSLWFWDTKKNSPPGTMRSIETLQIGSEKDWAQISTSSQHVLLLKTDGRMFAFGNNFLGQIGDGTKKDRPAPVEIGKDHSWKNISAGIFYSMAINSDGTLWAWGRNSENQLGIEKPQFSTEPLELFNDIE